MTDFDLDRIRAGIPANYEGPWSVQVNDDGHWLVGYPASNPLGGLVATVPDYGQHLAEFIARARKDVPALLTIADDAQYDFGSLLCVEGECDHAEEHDVPCPLVEQRYATADDVLELHRLRTLVERVKELTVSTDGEPLGHGEEIPVGEIVRVLAESESAEVRS